MANTELYIGIVAGTLTAASLLPQLIKIIREKKAGEISVVMYIVLMLGVAVWIIYGVLKNDLPVIITNAFSLLINLGILIFSIRYKSKSQ